MQGKERKRGREIKKQIHISCVFMRFLLDNYVMQDLWSWQDDSLFYTPHMQLLIP